MSQVKHFLRHPVVMFTDELGFNHGLSKGMQLVTGLISGWSDGEEAKVEKVEVVVTQHGTVSRYCLTAMFLFNGDYKFLMQDFEEALKNRYAETMD
jgi:hypothetical protein